MPTPEELLAKAQKPAEEALRLHAYERQDSDSAQVPSSVWYAAGVAAPCRAIQPQPDLVYQ